MTVRRFFLGRDDALHAFDEARWPLAFCGEHPPEKFAIIGGQDDDLLPTRFGCPACLREVRERSPIWRPT